MAGMLESFTPLGDFAAMERRMRRLFEDMGFAPALTPAADVYESGKEYVVELEVPGFDEKELDVSLADHTLTVIGERKEATEKKEKHLLLRERLEKRFERRFTLPSEADAKHVHADYEKGVLTVHVPKAGEAAAKKVEITAKR
jgi:HSP20 family protein